MCNTIRDLLYRVCITEFILKSITESTAIQICPKSSKVLKKKLGGFKYFQAKNLV